MIIGIAVLGTLAGSLASFFRPDDGEAATESSTGELAATAARSSDVVALAPRCQPSAVRWRP